VGGRPGAWAGAFGHGKRLAVAGLAWRVGGPGPRGLLPGGAPLRRQPGTGGSAHPYPQGSGRAAAGQRQGSGRAAAGQRQGSGSGRAGRLRGPGAAGGGCGGRSQAVGGGRTAAAAPALQQAAHLALRPRRSRAGLGRNCAEDRNMGRRQRSSIKAAQGAGAHARAAAAGSSLGTLSRSSGRSRASQHTAAQLATRPSHAPPHPPSPTPPPPTSLRRLPLAACGCLPGAQALQPAHRPPPAPGMCRCGRQAQGATDAPGVRRALGPAR
jgi:hypothetical protein